MNTQEEQQLTPEKQQVIHHITYIYCHNYQDNMTEEAAEVI